MILRNADQIKVNNWVKFVSGKSSEISNHNNNKKISEPYFKQISCAYSKKVDWIQSWIREKTVDLQSLIFVILFT